MGRGSPARLRAARTSEADLTSRRQILALGGALLLPRIGRAQAAIAALPFSTLKPGAPLPDWLEVQTFRGRPRHTEYALVEDEGRTVLRARADASTSGLTRALRVDPRVHPILAWRWKVTRLLAAADLASKAGDDFPARLYVTFDRLPMVALCYVWDTRAPAGTFAPNVYSGRVHMVVVDSGPTLLGRWVERSRSVAEDYRRAFGAEAPAVTGVAVSTDTDNTGERAESYFGDVEFRSPRPS